MHAMNFRENAKFKWFGSLLDPSSTKNLIEWKYNGKDESWCAPHMYPFWRRLTAFVPPGTSPNTVTVTGLALMGFLYIAVHVTIPYPSGQDVPTWLCCLCAFLLFAYQSCDAVDGQIGRRTTMYEHPSTELFDHGVDSIVTSLTVLSSVLLFQTGDGLISFLLVGGIWSSFFFSTWEQKYTGEIIFRGGPTNPTEGQLITIFGFLLQGFYPNVLQYSVSIRSVEISVMSVLIFFGFMGSCVSYCSSIRKVYERGNLADSLWSSSSRYCSIGLICNRHSKLLSRTALLPDSALLCLVLELLPVTLDF